MNKTPVIAIIDIGKTNKKLFLFDEDYKIVFQSTHQLEETVDEDGDACEDLEKLGNLVISLLQDALANEEYEVRAINFSAYGASFVYIDERGETVGALYNYLKQFPPTLHHQFYTTYGGVDSFSLETASPVLGNLNSGMQVYRLKYEKPALYNSIKYALHLPQYLCYLVSGQPVSDITSIGCHTNLWNFSRNQYHSWVYEENIIDKLPKLVSSDTVVPAIKIHPHLPTGVGLHDSSAALIPYLVSFKEPFILISTGTWCISINPFNQHPLTQEELQQDCLCYMTYMGNPVKASRLFAGQEHEQEVKAIANHFDLETNFYKDVRYDAALIERLKSMQGTTPTKSGAFMKFSVFNQRSLDVFSSAEEAYHQLMIDIMEQQVASTQLVLAGTKVTRIFVDGGFSKNPIYMNLLSIHFPEIEVYAASMAQATAIGAALAIHDKWNSNPLPNDLIELNFYSHSEVQNV